MAEIRTRQHKGESSTLFGGLKKISCVNGGIFNNLWVNLSVRDTDDALEGECLCVCVLMCVRGVMYMWYIYV